MDATLLEQIRHLCRDRAAYERLKAILVQQERLHQLSWEDRCKNLLPNLVPDLLPNLVPVMGADSGIVATRDLPQESEILATTGNIPISHTNEANTLLSNIIVREKSIAQLTDAIQRSPSLDLVLQIAVQVAQKLLQVDRVAIFRRHPDGRGEFITDAIATGVTSLADMPERQLSLARHLTESATIEHSDQTVDNIRSSSLSSHIVTVLEQIGISSYAANKIYAGQELWGTLVAFHGSFYHSWTESDRTSLSLVASQISVAIAITHLRQQSQTLSDDVRFLQHELDKLQATVSEIVEQQKLVKTLNEPVNEPVNESIDQLMEDLAEQQQAQLDREIIESLPEDSSKEFLEEPTQEYPETLVEVIHDDSIHAFEIEPATVLQVENIRTEDSSEVEAIAVEVIQSETVSENVHLVFNAKPELEESEHLPERSFQDIPQDIQEHISDWLGQEPLDLHQALDENNESEQPDAITTNKATNQDDIHESSLVNDQETINNALDATSNIVTEVITNYPANLSDGLESTSENTIEDSIQEISADIADENRIENNESNSESNLASNPENNIEDNIENIEDNIEMIEDIKISFPMSRSGLPPQFLVEQHDHSPENPPLAASANLPAKPDESSDDRDPAIEPQFIETILTIAGSGTKAREFLLDVIDDYLEEAPRLIQSIDRAIATNEQAKLLQLLNSLRSASEYVGALSVAYQCRQLESAIRANYVVLIYASLSQLAIESQRASEALRIERSRYNY